jgi:O-antigen ligase
MTALAVVLAVQGIQQAITGVGWAGQLLHPSYKDIRILWVGDWDGPNVLAILFVIGLAANLNYIFGRWSPATRVSGLVSSAFLMIGLYLTNSRGGMLALLATIGAYSLHRIRDVIAILGCAVLVVCVIAYAPSRMAEVNTVESSAHARLWLWETGILLVRSHPLWGIGKGQFQYHTYGNQIAHNNYIQVAAETGLVGFFFWSAIFYCSFKGLYQLQRLRAETPDQERLVSLSRAILLATTAFASATFFVTMELDILFVIWGLCSALIVTGRRAFPGFDISFTLKDAALILFAMIGILTVIYVATIV